MPAAAEARPARLAQEKAPASKPPQIPLGELLLRRDLWPAKVALTKPLTVERGKTLPVGRELSLYEFNGEDIALDGGDDIFECPVASTDVIERASAIKAKLTPEQLALDDNTLPQHPELWPTRVTVTRRMQFQNGKQVPVGREVALRVATIGHVELYDRELPDHFQAETFETNVLALARERMLLPQAQRDSFFVRSLAAALEPNAAASDANLAKADFVLVYRARLGCTRCAAFGPELAKFYERVKPAHANFETVFFSDDQSAEDAHKVFSDDKFPGRAVAYDRRLEAADLATAQQGQLLPLVYLYDRNGKLIAQNHPNGGKPSAADILGVLEKKLDAAH
jgi:hypothetical protein